MKVVDDLVCVGPGIWRNHLELKKKTIQTAEIFNRGIFAERKRKKPRNKYK
jgi:hypothetical protein